MARDESELAETHKDRERIDFNTVANPSRREKALETLQKREHDRKLDARLARNRGERPPKTFDEVYREFLRLAMPARKGRRDWHARVPESLISTPEYNACNEIEFRVLSIMLLHCFRHTGISAPGYKQMTKIMYLETAENAWRKEHPEKTDEPSPIEQRIQRAVSGLIAKGLVLRKSSACNGHAAEYLIARNQKHIDLFKSLNGIHAVNTIGKAKGIHAVNTIPAMEQE